MSLNGSIWNFLVWFASAAAPKSPAKTSELVFALEDEIGHGQQRASVFGIAAVEARFRATRVIVRESAHAVQCAGFANERDQCFRLYGIEFFFFQNAGDEFARVAMAVLHR